MDERLSSTLQTVEEQLACSPETAFFESRIHAWEIAKAPVNLTFPDTLIYNENE